VDAAGLSDAEYALWQAVPVAGNVDLTGEPDCAVRAEVVAALLLGTEGADAGQVPAVRLTGATIVGTLDLSYADVPHAMLLRDCLFVEKPVFDGMRGRLVNLSGSRLPGLDASDARIDGLLWLEGCQFDGALRLSRTQVDGSLSLRDAVIAGGDPAVHADSLVVTHDMTCPGMHVTGEILMWSARIGGVLALDAAHLTHPAGATLNADGLIAERGVFCAKLISHGELRFPDARIGRRLELDSTKLVNPSGDALNLRHARIGVLAGGQEHGSLLLDGCVYEAMERPEQTARWLGAAIHARDDYHPQPFEQLAAVLRGIGQDGEARDVLLGKQRRRRRTLPWPGRLWGHVQDWLVGYGYRPKRAAAWLTGLIAVATPVFAVEHPPAQSDAPDFNPFLYAVDLLVPVVGFGQEGAFNPQGWQQWFAAALIAAGWILATTIIAGATRVLSRQ
jgi:hypothetical protein